VLGKVTVVSLLCYFFVISNFPDEKLKQGNWLLQYNGTFTNKIR
jgi:hypothetical protein